ncbi:thioredoxin domain-containing protein [Lysobacter capsici]|uniref:hypothetical protein n=1 Tax=Lysobacter capsici TaxID=435897 RepID=UPI00398CFE08
MEIGDRRPGVVPERRACTPAAHADAARAVAAPEFVGIARWFNTPALSMAGLRGKVVLVEFWTYSCINCLRVAPHVKQWHEAIATRAWW